MIVLCLGAGRMGRGIAHAAAWVAVLPYLACTLALILAIIAVPQIALWFPALVGG